MHCLTPELFPGMLLAVWSFQAARAGLKLADLPLCLVLLGESLHLDLNSCKIHLTSIVVHSGILFRKRLVEFQCEGIDLQKSQGVVNHILNVSDTYAPFKDK